MTDTRYIVVLFYEDIGCPFRMNGRVRAFSSNPEMPYKKLGYAINKANKLFSEYLTDRVCVFKYKVGEHTPCGKYKDWCKDKERMVYNTDNIAYDG